MPGRSSASTAASGSILTPARQPRGERAVSSPASAKQTARPAARRAFGLHSPTRPMPAGIPPSSAPPTAFIRSTSATSRGSGTAMVMVDMAPLPTTHGWRGKVKRNRPVCRRSSWAHALPAYRNQRPAGSSSAPFVRRGWLSSRRRALGSSIIPIVPHSCACFV